MWQKPYDGNNLVEETNGAGGVVARYSQGLNIDEPLAIQRGGTTSYYQADGLRSVTSLSNTAGALAQTYTLDSFGNQTASTGSLTNPFRYTGREFDTETSLYYYRARYYEPPLEGLQLKTQLGLKAGWAFMRMSATAQQTRLMPSGSRAALQTWSLTSSRCARPQNQRRDKIARWTFCLFNRDLKVGGARARQSRTTTSSDSTA
jgi:RHS repeat-associated protein